MFTFYASKIVEMLRFSGLKQSYCGSVFYVTYFIEQMNVSQENLLFTPDRFLLSPLYSLDWMFCTDSEEKIFFFSII